MAEYKYIVFTNPVEGREEEYNRWYTDVHLGEVTAIPGFTGAQRFRIRPTGDEVPKHRYLAIYDMQTDDVSATLSELMARAGSGKLNMSDALGPDVVTCLYEALPGSGELK